MAGSKLTELDEELSPAGTDLVYVVTDPDSSPTAKKVRIENLPGGGGGGGGGGGDLIESIDGDRSARVVTDASHPAQVTIATANYAPVGWERVAEMGMGAYDMEAVWSILLIAGSSVSEMIRAAMPHDGPGQLGFFGATPVARPQIDGSTATVADLCAALHALGLIEDTSL